MSTADLRQLIKLGDVDKLEQLVYEGQGKKLAGYQFASDSRVKEFIKTVPGLLVRVLTTLPTRYILCFVVENFFAARCREQRKSGRAEGALGGGTGKEKEDGIGKRRGWRWIDTQGDLLWSQRHL